MGLRAGAVAVDATVNGFLADLDILRSSVRFEAACRPPPKPHLGCAAGGAGSPNALAPKINATTTPDAAESQSFLDNLVADFGPIGAADYWAGRWRRL